MSAWTPVETGVQQICYLLAEVQKPGTNQAQVRSQIPHSKPQRQARLPLRRAPRRVAAA